MDNDPGATTTDIAREVPDRVVRVIDSRAIIEQTKGMLMFIHGVDADGAFDILRGQSQQHNVKLRVIAEQIMNDLVELAKTSPLTQRLDTDRVLLSAHRRIADAAARMHDGQRKVSNRTQRLGDLKSVPGLRG